MGTRLSPGAHLMQEVSRRTPPIRSGAQPPVVPQRDLDHEDRCLALSMAKGGRPIHLVDGATEAVVRQAKALEREGVLRFHSQDLQSLTPWIRYVLNPDWGL